ncbi:MAG: hypothetical protein WDO70_02390 [Alphaproteobacteria bacterium]
MEFCKQFNAKTQNMEKNMPIRWSSPRSGSQLHLRY